mmetsp:Transcript_25329/g.73308  ORF Transcript_25329/g.73308 Transcript_25329/m.73308 type:complete len:202 (-) Transcript_25329:1273-1878(-)
MGCAKGRYDRIVFGPMDQSGGGSCENTSAYFNIDVRHQFPQNIDPERVGQHERCSSEETSMCIGDGVDLARTERYLILSDGLHCARRHRVRLPSTTGLNAARSTVCGTTRHTMTADDIQMTAPWHVGDEQLLLPSSLFRGFHNVPGLRKDLDAMVMRFCRIHASVPVQQSNSTSMPPIKSVLRPLQLFVQFSHQVPLSSLP